MSHRPYSVALEPWGPWTADRPCSPDLRRNLKKYFSGEWVLDGKSHTTVEDNLFYITAI